MKKILSVRKPAFLAITATLLAGACAPRPVAELEVGVDRVPLVYASSSRITVEWKSLRPLDPPGATPFVFVHLLDGGGNLVWTFDRPISKNWTEVDDTIEIWQSALAEPLPAGSYRLTAGIYDLASGQRWRLETSGSEIDEGEYQIATVEVESSEPKTPDLAFEGDWLAPDEGQPHNLGRRWMGPRGSIRLLATAGWSELVLSVSITALPVDRHRPVFEGDATTPRLVIRNGCDSGSETRIDGYGVHSVSLRLDAVEDCAISLEPNFVMLDLEDSTRRSVGLESAFFRPSSGSSSGG